MQTISRRQIGIFLIVLSIAFFFLIMSFTQDVQKLYAILHKDCPLPADVCPYNTAIPGQSAFAFALDGLLGATGLFLVITGGKSEKISIQVSEKIKTIIKNLEPDEQKIFSMVKDNGAIFQSELVEKSSINKVKVTRILDKLEGRGLVERKRRGMTNVVMLKNQ